MAKVTEPSDCFPHRERVPRPGGTPPKPCWPQSTTEGVTPGSPRPGRVLRPRGGKRGAKEAGEESRWGGSDRGRPAPPAAEPISPPPPQEPASGFLSGFVSSSPSDSNGHRCQWSPQSPALPASWGNMEAASEIPRDPDRRPEAQRVVPPTLGTK